LAFGFTGRNGEADFGKRLANLCRGMMNAISLPTTAAIPHGYHDGALRFS
jgi:hypothetical protein